MMGSICSFSPRDNFMSLPELFQSNGVVEEGEWCIPTVDYPGPAQEVVSVCIGTVGTNTHDPS